MGRPGTTGWRAHLAGFTYTAACSVAAPAVLPLLALHPRLSGGFWQRLGRAPGSDPGARAAPLWLHGSSAGDVAALMPLARRLNEHGLEVALSAFTRTGHEMARRRADPMATVFRAPLDLPGPVGAVLDRLRPGCLVLECLEMWPNLVSACQRRSIPVAVVNGRLSPSSLAAYLRMRWLFEPCFRGLSLVTALTEQDARRFEEAGTRPARIRVLSSSKHGGAALGGPPPEPLPKVVLGSLHQGEEALLFPWIPRLLAAAPGLGVVVAPRYPHRARASLRALRALGLSAELRSNGEPPPGGVMVVDRMGALAGQYRRACAALVGGSLIAHGGHNVVEPAAQGVPVLVGTHTDNCAHEVELLLEAGAAVVVRDGHELNHRVLALLGDRSLYDRASEAGRLVAADLAGAADELARLILALVKGDQ